MDIQYVRARSNQGPPSFSLKRLLWAGALAWSILIGALLIVEIRNVQRDGLELARAEAKTVINQDINYRRWAASHGGIYVPVTENTPPNPYLAHDPERDIKTPSGRLLTLMNPAYMIRQLYEKSSKLNGILGHITSLNPTRPENAPDDWEASALRTFAQGKTECSEKTILEGKPYFRMMWALTIEKGCLKCHAAQGYKEGDVCGGISVSIPFEPFLVLASAHTKSMVAGYGLLWVLGLLGLCYGTQSLRHRMRERNQAEEALRESEARYRILFEGSHDAIIILEPPSWKYTSGNSAMVIMFRAKNQEGLISCHPWDLSPERQSDGRASCEKAMEIIEAAMREGSQFFEWTHKRLDGEEFPSTVLLTRMEQAGKRFLQATIKDITVQKRSEKALRESEEKYRSIVETTAEWIWEMDLNGRHTFSNPGVTSILGYRLEEFIGVRAMSLIHVEDWPEVEVNLPRLIADKRGWRGWTLRWRHKNGSYRYLESNANPIINAAGELAGYRGADRDVTERKMAEEEKQKLYEQLVQAQKMEAIGLLAGGVAHDFNNMLAVISGHVELALDQVEASQPLHACLEEIRLSAQRAIDLTRQLLGFARRQTVTTKVLDLNSTVESMFTMLRRLIGEDVQMVWMPGQDLWPVKMDPSQIDQILVNLAVNARDAIAGTGEITIETANMAVDEANFHQHTYFVPGEYVALTVSDNGCGMDKNTLAHIFEPFFTTKCMGKGTGLGLSTVFGIVKQNQGFINVYSEPDQGTTFKIYFPRYVGKIPLPLAEGPPEVASGGSETILLVEDDSALLTLSKIMLKRLGYSVLVASTPSEAIALAKEYAGRIDLLMTDVVMPEMNGHDLSKQLLSLSADLKCLFMSGYTASVVSLNSALGEGMPFLQKPFTLKTLAVKLREVLDRKQTR